MKKIRLLKTILIPTLGITALGTVAAIATSCNCSTVKVTGVELDKSELSLEVGGSDKLTATIKPAEATDKSVT